MDSEMLEIPAGKLDVEGEDRPSAARRELVEEAGLYANDLVELGRFHNSIGFCDEETTIYLSMDLDPVAPEAVSVEAAEIAGSTCASSATK